VVGILKYLSTVVKRIWNGTGILVQIDFGDRLGFFQDSTTSLTEGKWSGVRNETTQGS
jgi:hypothetical protein